MDDLRFQWFKEIVYKTFFLEPSDLAFSELFERDATAYDSIRQVISGATEVKSCLFFCHRVEEQEVEVPDIYEATEASSHHEDSGSYDSEKINSETASSVDKTEDKSVDYGLDNPEFSVDSPDDIETTEAFNSKRLKRKSTTSLLQIVKKNVLHLSLNIVQCLPVQRFIFFLQTRLEPIPLVTSLDEAYDIMLDFFEIGSINQHPLLSMNRVMANVYVPILEKIDWISYVVPTTCKMDENQIPIALVELQKEMQGFVKSCSDSISQVDEPFMFHVPNIPPDCDIEELATDKSFIAEAEELVIEWAGVVSDILEQYVQKKPPQNDLLAEIKFWKQQKFSLSSCSDQLNQRAIQQIFKILKIAEKDVNDFESKVGEVETHLRIASDNCSYLKLLDPLLKNLQPNKSFEDCEKAIEDLFLLLKMIWIQSNYYKDTSNMCRLIKGVADVLKQKVKDHLNLEHLFRQNLCEVHSVATKSAKLLIFWKEQYLKQSESVKGYGGSFWWGFDITTFFTETDHIVCICSDLQTISKMLEEVLNVFKTNMKYFVKDVKRLEVLETRAFGIAYRIQYTSFDVFDPEQKSNWAKLVKTFHRDKNKLEVEIKSYVTKMFQSVLTWQDAYALSRSFSTAGVSSSMLSFINESRNDMLMQFLTEIQETENEFLTLRDGPPVFEGVPKTLSAILWVQSLIQKLSVSVSQICDHPNLSKQEIEVQATFKKTLSLLENYKLQTYTHWKVIATAMLQKFLQENVLKESEEQSLKSESSNFHKVLKYQVNFPVYLEMVSIEAKLLEYYGFGIPTLIKNTLFQENIFFDYRHKLRMTLDALRDIVSNLTDAEISILDNPIDSLCSVLDVGLNNVQWESSEILDFVKKAKRAVHGFGSVIKQSQNVFSEINSRIQCLERFKLFQFNECDKTDIPTCEEYFNDARAKMKKAIGDIVKIHSSLELLLKNLEKITNKTYTGRAAAMKQYYQQCEERVLKSLLRMILSNLEFFKNELMKNYILQYLEIAFECGNEVVTSSLKRVELIFIAFLKDSVESTRKILRWLNGTCIKAPPITVEDSKEQLEFSYYLDICLHPKVKNIALIIIDDFIETLNKLKRIKL